jgi:hypothetical protein
MKNQTAWARIALAAIVAYGLLISIARMDYNSVSVDEAYHITIGHQVLAQKPCPGCAYATGSIYAYPIAAAIGDSIGGLYGARVVNVLLGLGLTLLVYGIGRLLFDVKTGLLAAALLLCSGQTLYLMKLATSDMMAAFFLGLSFFLVVVAGRRAPGRINGLALAGGAVALFLASVTKYLVPVFVPFLVVYVWHRQGPRRAFPLFGLPLAALLALYAYFAVYPVLDAVANQVTDFRSSSHAPFSTLSDWTFRWVAMGYLLAVFGAFHERYGRSAVVLIVLSAPLVVLHLVTQSEQSVNKNVISSFVFLTPAAALGVDHLGNLFSMRSASGATKTFFTVAVLVVVWAYGINNLKWFEKQYPDVTPIIEFFQEEGHDGMTVATNGWDGVMYQYALQSCFPNARIIHVTDVADPDHSMGVTREAVDFVVCEDLYYGKEYPCADYGYIFGADLQLLRDFEIEHSWGVTDARIFGRR